MENLLFERQGQYLKRKSSPYCTNILSQEKIFSLLYQDTFIHFLMSSMPIDQSVPNPDIRKTLIETRLQGFFGRQII